MSIASDLIRGHTDTIILARLMDGDNYGYEINKSIHQMTGGKYELKEATLYTAFRRLEQAGCISSYWGDELTGARRRYYRITDSGRETYEGLITIKGIGDYTASAIASLAFGQPVPVIDGNVNRVIARLHGVQLPINKPAGQKEIRTHAERMMVCDQPGTYNQSIMEFGALQCVPQNPDCSGCIFNRICIAFQSGFVHIVPIKEKTAKIATRYFHYLYVCFGNRTYIRQRSIGDIWTGLYEFPMIETVAETEPHKLIHTPEWQSYFDGQTPIVVRVSYVVTHRLTHRILKIRFYEVIVNRSICGENLIEIPASDIQRYAVPKVVDNFLKEIKTKNPKTFY